MDETKIEFNELNENTSDFNLKLVYSTIMKYNFGLIILSPWQKVTKQYSSNDEISKEPGFDAFGDS